MALQKLVNNSTSYKINKIVLDLSLNGGGSVFTNYFLSSYLCGRDNTCMPQDAQLKKGGVTVSLYNPHTLSFAKGTIYADINQDNKYDNNDYLPSDVELYCITSNTCFSCGNMLPCHLEDCTNCKFIGDTSGGGCCFVDNHINIGLGNDYRGSSIFHTIKNTSTDAEHIISTEEGVTPKYYFIRNTEENASKFYNRESILQYIVDHSNYIK